MQNIHIIGLGSNGMSKNEAGELARGLASFVAMIDKNVGEPKQDDVDVAPEDVPTFVRAECELMARACSNGEDLANPSCSASPAPQNEQASTEGHAPVEPEYEEARFCTDCGWGFEDENFAFCPFCGAPKYYGIRRV